MFHGQTGLNHLRPKTRLERLTSANGCLVVFPWYFIRPVTSNNRKKNNPKGLRSCQPNSSLLVAAAISPCLDHLCCAKGSPSLLSPPHSPAAPMESLEAAGAPVQRRLINASYSANKCAPFTFKYCIPPQQTRDMGWGNDEDPCGSVCRSPVCVKFANNSPCEDSRAFSLLWGLVWRFSWENQPLCPLAVWCPLSLEDF